MRYEVATVMGSVNDAQAFAEEFSDLHAINIEADGGGGVCTIFATDEDQVDEVIDLLDSVADDELEDHDLHGLVTVGGI